jgi:hypothetical protein
MVQRLQYPWFVAGNTGLEVSWRMVEEQRRKRKGERGVGHESSRDWHD